MNVSISIDYYSIDRYAVEGKPSQQPAALRSTRSGGRTADVGPGFASPSLRRPGLAAGGPLKASRPLIRVLVINDNVLWINDFI